MRLKIAALTLAFGLGVVGLASAQESGNWFTRMFTSGEKTDAAKKKDAPAEPSKASVSSKARMQKAKVDLERRQEVCQKLRDIALEQGDDDLFRKADQLDQRAWDLFAATKNRLLDSQRPLGAVNASEVGLTKSSKKGDR